MLLKYIQSEIKSTHVKGIHAEYGIMVGVWHLCHTHGHEEPQQRCTNFGKRISIFQLKGNNINTNISTDAEVVGVDGMITHIIWTY